MSRFTCPTFRGALVVLVGGIAAILPLSGCDANRTPSSQKPKSVAVSFHEDQSSTVQVVGLKTERMNYHAAMQRGQQWCWAACVQMALSAKGVNASQEAIVHRAFGELVDHAGSPLDIIANLNGLAITRNGRPIRVMGTVRWGPPSFAALKSQLEAGTPVIVGYETPGFPIGHAVIVTAVIYHQTPNGPEILRVMVRDPAPDYANELGKRILSADEFNRVNQYYLIAVSAID